MQRYAETPVRHEDPDGLPDHLREAPASRVRWDFPTAWLFGADFIASLGHMAVSKLLRFDPRDWMSPGAPIDLASAVEPATAQDPAACWIDFFSDTGDSARLVYQLAYLLQQDALEVADRDGVPLVGCDGAPRRLPRGRALILGGDIAYPVSTRRQLVARIRAPFLWARRKLEQELKLSPDRPDVPLLAIPGNHDYYNLLDGYHRQFRAACPPVPAGAAAAAPCAPLAPDPVRDPPLALPGFARCQEASYFALLLPFDWRLLALDLHEGSLDERQRSYFLSLPPPADPDAAPKRIVVTSRPAFVYHGPSPHAGELERAFELLGLETAFVRGGELRDPSAIQLDLGGDDHIYERYWGATAGPEDPAPRDRRRDDPRAPRVSPARPNYASVVSGLGGAFHHPAQLCFGDTAPARAWPGAERSAAAIGERLMRPRKVFQAGAVGILGAAVALLCAGLIALADHCCDVLGLPFALAAPRPEMVASAQHLAIVASIAGALVVLGAAALAGVAAIRRLTAPIRTGAPGGWWARATRRLSHAEFVFWLLRWLGANRRSAWAVLVSLPAWLPTAIVLCGVPYALLRCPRLASADDGFVPLYVAIVALVLGMMALAAAVGGAAYRRPGVTLPRKILAHVVLVAFGALIGVLIVWTPYAWMRLVVQGELGAWSLLLFAGYMPLRLALVRSGFLGWPTRRRRPCAVLAFAAVVAWAVAPPIALTPVERLAETPPLLAVVPMVVFGAYFACLWIGWYFLLCLQWNAHPDQAGSTARVSTFAQFLRIKLTADAAEVWAIAAAAPAPARSWRRRFRPSFTGDVAGSDDHPIEARVIDHFVLRRGPAPAADPAPPPRSASPAARSSPGSS